jgi:hypothetical protein
MGMEKGASRAVAWWTGVTGRHVRFGALRDQCISFHLGISYACVRTVVALDAMLPCVCGNTARIAS